MTVREAHIHNLPPQPTPFVGRKSEIMGIVDRFQDKNCRLLTLVGSGGIGKTRLAIESIQHLSQSDFKHGVFYVPLAPLSSAENVVTIIINVLGILIGDEGTPQDELVKFLSQRNLLLVMDNFEHILDGSDIVTDILNNALNVKILTTSRESLNLRMEHVWQVHGMRYPESDEPEDINQYDALNLFVERAMQIRHDFSPGAEQVAIIQICQLVDGLPLAIELAAGWLKTLSCHNIIQQIKRGIDFLATRNRDVPELHRSIRAVFDHSWNLLSSDEQAVFPRLSVFRGGFTLDAAEHVADAKLITLSGLVEKSMVRRDVSGRYDVHELLRQYAEEQLTLSGDFDLQIKYHMHYFGNFMADRAPDIKGRRQLDSLNEIVADFDNIVEAWRQGVHRADGDVLDNMMETLALYIDIRSLYTAGENLFREAINRLSSSELNPIVYNRLQTRYIQVWILQDKRPTPQHIVQMNEDCLKFAENNSDEMTVMLCLWLQGWLYYLDVDGAKSFSSLKQARGLAIELQTPYYEGRIFRVMDDLFMFKTVDDSQYETEVHNLHQEVTDRIGDIDGFTDTVSKAAARNFIMGKLDNAQRYWTLALPNFRAIGNTKAMGVVIWSLGTLAFFRGNFAEAVPLFIDAMRVHSQTNFFGIHFEAYSSLGRISLIQGDIDRSREFFDKSSHYLKVRPDRVNHIHNNNTLLALTSNDYESARKHLYDALLSAGVVLRWVRASQTLALTAFVLHQDDEGIWAVETLGLVLGQFDHATHWIRQWRLMSQLQADLENELGVEAYRVAWERGVKRDLEETVTELLIYLGDDDTNTSEFLSQPLIEPLTTRELDVLELMGDGYSNPDIAKQLFVTVGTIKAHAHNIYQKLGVNNRTQAVLQAKKIGLL